MGKKQTREEYIDKLSKKNPNIELVGEYVNSQTPALHKCKIDGYEWMARPAKIIYGQGCPKCGGRVKMTHDEYVQRLAVNNPNIEVIGTYAGSNIAIRHHCMIHDMYWDAQPSSMLRGSGCYKCKSEKIYASKSKTHEQYVYEASVVNPYVEVIGQYVNADTPILHKCLIHGVEWNAYPASILRGCGCVLCGIERSADGKRKTHEQYVKELKEINPNIIPLTRYNGALTPILHKCLIDGYEWMARPANTLSGKGCPKCGGSAKKTHEEYVREVSIINPDVVVVGHYIDAKTPILHMCKVDGNKWFVAPTDILSGKGCPQCKESHGERAVRLWFEKHGVEYVREYKFEDCRDEKTLPFDFYIPQYNAACEVQGIQHYKPVEHFGGEDAFIRQQHHDKIKADYCKANNIRLLCIPYYEDVEEQLNNFLFI